MKTISFSFCFLGTPPRSNELPAFSDLQFPNCSQGKLDLGAVERRGTVFKLVQNRGRSFFLSVCSLPKGSPVLRSLEPLRSQKWGQGGMKVHINPKQECR